MDWRVDQDRETSRPNSQPGSGSSISVYTSSGVALVLGPRAEHIFSDAAVAGLTADLLVYLRMPAIRGALLH
jgi:hypothetical protein